MKLFDAPFGNKKVSKDRKIKLSKSEIEEYKTYMTSQFAALYIKENDEKYKELYLSRLMELDIKEESAEKLFEFDCSVIRKFNKGYLLLPEFTKTWFFGLLQPFFLNYPKTKEDILNEHFLTVSELCKIVDEAEWHFWNSHERALSDEVWGEICEWRLRGKGMQFAGEYFQMIESETGASTDEINRFIGSQGEHLSKYKWD